MNRNTEKTLTAKARVSEALKTQAEAVLERNNISMSTLIRSTLEHVIQNKAIPDFINSQTKTNDLDGDSEVVNEKPRGIFSQIEAFMCNAMNIPTPSESSANLEKMRELALEYQDCSIPMVSRAEEIERLSLELREWKENNKTANNKDRKLKILEYVDRVIFLSDQMDMFREKEKIIQEKIDETNALWKK
tara:strand:+ start:1472 stop:2041 length:570 start_codon:yes stop_codon:yes gene_type:complete